MTSRPRPGPDDVGDLLSRASGWMTASDIASRLRSEGFSCTKHEVDKILAKTHGVVAKADGDGFVKREYLDTPNSSRYIGTSQLWALDVVAQRLVAERDERMAVRVKRRLTLERYGVPGMAYSVLDEFDISRDRVTVPWDEMAEILGDML